MTGEPEGKKEGENNEQGQQKTEDFVSKADYEKLVAELNEIKEEVVSPDYIEFLTSKSGKAPEPKKEEGTKAPADDYEKLSKKEIIELMSKQTKELVEGTLKNREAEVQKAEQARIAEEVADFAKTHTDFSVYRPVMYGLSLDPKYSKLSLNQLYDTAKAHIESLKKGDTEEDKKRKSAMSGEKPGGASKSFEKPADKKSAEQLNAEALAEVKAKFGTIPSE